MGIFDDREERLSGYEVKDMPCDRCGIMSSLIDMQIPQGTNYNICESCYSAWERVAKDEARKFVKGR